jgi:hypothetical protein
MFKLFTIPQGFLPMGFKRDDHLVRYWDDLGSRLAFLMIVKKTNMMPDFKQITLEPV